MWRQVYVRLRTLWARRRQESELDEEIRFHLAREAEERIEAGMSPEQARAAARRDFGNVTLIRELTREAWGWASVERLVQDARGALRAIRRNPAFSAVAAGTLALAVGVNVVMFSVLNTVLFRPLPYRFPHELVMLWTETPSQDLRENRSAFWNVEEWRHQSRSFRDIAVFDSVALTLTHAGETQRVQGARISPNLFPLLGIEPRHGRSFSAEEAGERRRLALVSHRFWQARFGGSLDALGASVELDGRPSRIVGVLPEGFRFGSLDADVFEPHTLFPDWEARRVVRGRDSWFVLDRLRPGVTVEEAQAEMSTIAGRLDARMPAADSRALLVAEVALAIVLLVGAGLLVRSWWQVEGVDPGFRPERVLAMQVGAPALMAPAQRADFYRRALERIEALPGVERAGFISDAFIGSSPERTLTTERGGEAVSARLQFRSDEVSDGLFQALGTRLRGGRFFSPRDGAASPRVAIVNDALARRLWPGEDAVGRRLKRGPADAAGAWLTVVGVVDDMRRQGLEREPIPQIFEPVAQNPSGAGFLLVRTARENPEDLAAAVQAAVRQLDSRAPLYGVSTLEARLRAFYAPRGLQTSIVVGFAAVALLMAAIGIYGLIQYAVSTRTKEIAIRLAVGADTGDIFRMVVGEGLALSGAGAALGLLGGAWVGWAARNLLFEVGPLDPLTFIGGSALLLSVALAASDSGTRAGGAAVSRRWDTARDVRTTVPDRIDLVRGGHRARSGAPLDAKPGGRGERARRPRCNARFHTGSRGSALLTT